MDLSFLLLTIISQIDGERSINASYHLLRGKRSGQTLQDVEYYSLGKFFNLLPKLKSELFLDAVDQLKSNDYITIKDDSTVYITTKGKEMIQTLPKYHFNGWDYRGREHVFFSRLSLIVQTLSFFNAGEKSFMPMQNDHDTQLFVKDFFRRPKSLEPKFSKQLRNELQSAIEQSGMDEIQKIIIVHRFGGYQHTGWTWKQLSDEMAIQPFTLTLLYIESLHRLLQTIEKSEEYPLLSKIATDIKVQTYLTDSTVKTKELFEKGLSMQEISQVRHLKMSTIEDHFVEISMNDENFPIEEFVTLGDFQAVITKSTELGTKKLRLLKEEFTSLSYFQLRLILGTKSKGGDKWISNQSY